MGAKRVRVAPSVQSLHAYPATRWRWTRALLVTLKECERQLKVVAKRYRVLELTNTIN